MIKYNITINGKTIETEEGLSILEALLLSGETLTRHVGCFGQGVCGSCTALIKRKDDDKPKTALACETRVGEGLQVILLQYIPLKHHHNYNIDQQHSYKIWDIISLVDQIFPEAKNCRHCGGCDNACPRSLKVQEGVRLAISGDFNAANIFEECIMCDLCSITCPEMITPNHLGIFMSKLKVSHGFKPIDLVYKLHQINTGNESISYDMEERR